jgi:hypothetical protein
MMIGMNMMGSGGCRLFLAGVTMTLLSAVVTLSLTGRIVTFSPEPLEWWLTLPVFMLYPMLWMPLSPRSRLLILLSPRYV